jgi:DNA-binding MarR family transcriptional regulator
MQPSSALDNRLSSRDNDNPLSIPLESEARARAHALSELSLALFRAHGALLSRADEVVAPLGLTSARWQVLATLALAGEALPVPAVARAMSLTRQAIQKQVDLLSREGLVVARPNPAHGRSPLFQLSGAGRAALARADQRWALEAAQLSRSVSSAALKATTRLLDQLTERVLAAPDETELR